MLSNGLHLLGVDTPEVMWMARDYVKYSTYRTRRSRRHRFLMKLGLVIGVIILGWGLLFFKSHNRQQIVQATTSKPKQKIVEIPAPKPPEPKFDFYNILPQRSLILFLLRFLI